MTYAEAIKLAIDSLKIPGAARSWAFFSRP